MKLPDTYRLPYPVFLADDQGRIANTNAAFEALLPGRIGEDWISTFEHLDAIHISAAGERGVTGESGTFTAPLVTGEGDTRFFEIVCQELLDDDGAPGLLGVLLDITEQTRREAEIRTILETAVDAIIIIDEDGRIEAFNRAASSLFGYRADEVVGTAVSRLMPPPHRELHDSYLRRYLQTGEKRIIGIGRELEALHRDGQRIPIHLAVSEIRLRGQRRFTGFVRDLSEQHAAREALAEQREKLAHVGRLSIMGEMTASIAHEINQPLTAIAMYAQSSLKLLQRPQPDLGRLAEALEKLSNQSLRAGAIIERIQRFARAQEGRREVVALNALLLDLLKLAEGDARINDIQISFELQEGLPPVQVDPIQIQQVALNLVRNAIDAMQEVGCRFGNAIVIRSRRLDNGRLEVAVSDQGPGVAQDQIDLLFKPFHTTKKDGMGMGLSICRTIIAEHNGELAFRGGTDGGASFYFTLPTASHDE